MEQGDPFLYAALDWKKSTLKALIVSTVGLLAIPVTNKVLGWTVNKLKGIFHPVQNLLMSPGEGGLQVSPSSSPSPSPWPIPAPPFSNSPPPDIRVVAHDIYRSQSGIARRVGKIRLGRRRQCIIPLIIRGYY